MAHRSSLLGEAADTRRLDRLVVMLLCTGVGLIAALFVFWSTPRGLGTITDSAIYIGSAQSMLSGDGFTFQNEAGRPAPVTLLPPGYPALLALTTITGTDVMTGAQWLSAASLAALLCLATYVIWRLSSSRLFALLGATLLATAESILRVHLTVLTDQLFLLLTLVILYLLWRYGESSGRRQLVLLGTLCATALLTRYVGVTLFLTVATTYFLAHGRSVRQSASGLVWLSATTLTPFVVWIVRNLLIAQTGAGRSIAIHPLGPIHFLMMLYTVSGWLLPGVKSTIPAGLALVGVTGGLTWLNRKAEQRILRFFELSVLFSAIYLGFLAISITFVDAGTPLNFRLLAPVYLLWLISFVTLLALSARQLRALPFVRLLPVAAALVMVILSTRSALLLLTESRYQGLGLTSLALANAPTWTYIRDLPTEANLYSNLPEAVYLHTGRYAALVPQMHDRFTLRRNEAYEAEVMALAERVRHGGTFLLYLEAGNYRDYVPGQAELEEALAAPVLMRNEGATIYGRVQTAEDKYEGVRDGANKSTYVDRNVDEDS